MPTFWPSGMWVLAVWLPDREYDLTALAGGDEAVNPFVAAETYHRQADGR